MVRISAEVWMIRVITWHYWKVKVKWSHYRPGVAQRVGRGIALLFHDRGTRRGWVVSTTPRAHFTPGKDPVPILQEAGWDPGPVWTGGKYRTHRDSEPYRPARSSVAIPTKLPGPPRCPEGSRKLTFPDYVQMAQNGGKVISLTHRPLLAPGNTPGTHFY